jgi:hypothetical protein
MDRRINTIEVFSDVSSHVAKMIFFTKGKGLHKDYLTSFELALREAAISDLNLVSISSIGFLVVVERNVGPVEPYVLADLYAWLEAHSGLSHSYVTTPASTIGANTSSLNTNTTSPSSASGKR